MKTTLKLIGEYLAVIGLAFMLWDNINAPHALLLESSPSRPPWVSWIAFVVTATGTIIFIVANHLPSKKPKKTESTEQSPAGDRLKAPPEE